MAQRRIEWSGDAGALPDDVRGASVHAATPPERRALAALAETGAAELSLTLFGARREVHDWHAGGDGAFDAVIRALTAARALGIPTAVRTPVTRSNARVLAELPPLLRARDVRRWELAWPRAEGDDWTARVPRLGMGAPPMLAAAARAEKLGLKVRIEGLPICVAGPYADRIDDDDVRAFGARCADCAARERCLGVDEEYLARFGEGELRPIR